jgi:hypothetical protein
MLRYSVFNLIGPQSLKAESHEFARCKEQTITQRRVALMLHKHRQGIYAQEWSFMENYKAIAESTT